MYCGDARLVDGVEMQRTNGGLVLNVVMSITTTS